MKAAKGQKHTTANESPSFLKFGKFLQESRMQAGFSQKDIADELGYKTAQVVSDWERGIRTPPGFVLRKLVHLYDLPIEQFYDCLLETQTAHLQKKLRKVFGMKG